MSRNSPHLTGEVRARLLSRVEALRQGNNLTGIEQRPEDLSSYTDFNTLPGYPELKMQRSVADALHIESPFFRVHDSRVDSHTTIAGRSYLNFSSYDYLGLNG